jgi:uncharacterized delta-60 repeat protein
MDLTRIDTIVQFTAGSSTPWGDLGNIVPVGAIIIDTVNKIVKEGDGTKLYADLPVCLDYDFTGGTSSANTPLPAEEGNICIAENSEYSASAVKLATLLTQISGYVTANAAQQTRIDAAVTANLVSDVPANTPNGTIVICSGGKYIASTRTMTQLISDLALLSVGRRTHINDIEWYTDANLSIKLDNQNEIIENNTYWVKVTGFHDTTEFKNVDIGMTTVSPNVTVTTDKDYITYGILAAVYGGANDDAFWGVAVDSNDNIICVGETSSEGVDSPTYANALVIKFDTNLNILARKIYNGANYETFRGVAIDSNDNIICAGHTYSEGVGSTTYCSALVVKFDTNLNILARKVYSGANHDAFWGVAIDSNNNIICAGATLSEGIGSPTYINALVVKFDTNLAILARKIYSGTNSEIFWGVAIDSNDNIICVGHTLSEGVDSQTYTNALVVKFDSNLNIVARKYYGGTNYDEFWGVAVDSNDNIICVGCTLSEGVGSPTYWNALVIKFDTNLAILARKIYGGTNTEIFWGVAVDSNDNIICAGETFSEGIGSPTYTNTLIVKFDTNLNIIAHKIYGGVAEDVFRSIAIDSNNNIICVGPTRSEGIGATTYKNALAIKFDDELSVGTVTGTVLTGLTLGDSALTLTDSNLTLGDSALTLTDSNLTLADSTLTLVDSALTLEQDTLVVARKTVPTRLYTAIYSQSTSATFNSIISEPPNNIPLIIAVGQEVGADGITRALIVRFSDTLNVLARKIYAIGSDNTVFNEVALTSTGDIICVGNHKNATSGLIVKFDMALVALASKILDSTSAQNLFNVVIDSNSNNIFAIGYTSESGYHEGLIVKLDSNLAVIDNKKYGNSAGDTRFYGIALDTSGNPICVGYTSVVATGNGVVVKFDSNLNILLLKNLSVTGHTGVSLKGVVVTDTNYFICVGSILDQTDNDYALIVKLDSNLNLIASKLYGSETGDTSFGDISITINDEFIICVGNTTSAGAGSSDMVIVKLDIDLVLINDKTYGSINAEEAVRCHVSPSSNIFLAGSTILSGIVTAMAVKIQEDMPNGTYTNKTLSTLVLSDPVLNISDVSCVLNNATMTSSTSALTSTSDTLSTISGSGGVFNDTTIMDANGPVFKVNLGELSIGEEITPVTFNITTDDGNETIAKDISVNVVGKYYGLAAVYGGANNDLFNGVAVDANGNIICAGWTYSEGVGSQTYHSSLVVKFDSNLNILARKVYGGTSNDLFNDVAVDSNNNIICVGATTSEGTGVPTYANALVVKFDTNLNILARKIYSGSSTEEFNGVVIDSNGNIICVGLTYSEGVGSLAYYSSLVVKFDTNLNILARKIYSGSSTEEFNGVVIDSNNNIICAGQTYSEGTVGSALVVKFDNNLNILARKYYGGSSHDGFYAVALDSNNNIICVGYTQSEGVGIAALVVKFDSNLNILARKIYNGNYDESFNGVAVDANNNIICTGHTYSEGASSPTYSATLVVKFDTNLNIVARKIYSGANHDMFWGVAIDSNNNIICAGYTTSEGVGSPTYINALVVKLDDELSFGTLTGTVLTGLTLSDSNLTLVDSNLTLADSTLTLADSALTLADSTLTLANSALTLEKDTLYL